jgi:hypothetical protein
MSNNIHFEHPPIMNDGRNYATFVPACALNNKIQNNAGIDSNFSYRRYLIENAVELMKTNQVVACDNTGPCLGNFNFNPLTAEKKHIYENYFDKTQPYGYESSDLKSLYLSREALAAKKDAPYLKQ